MNKVYSNGTYMVCKMFILVTHRPIMSKTVVLHKYYKIINLRLIKVNYQKSQKISNIV